jgi:hypothetical protein
MTSSTKTKRGRGPKTRGGTYKQREREKARNGKSPEKKETK